MPVNTARQDYTDVSARWKRLRDCYEGRDAVLKSGSAYVPDLPGLDAVKNGIYRSRGSFYNAVRRTTQGLVGAIFQKSPETKVADSLKPFMENVTLTNVTFEMFAADTGREAMLIGRYGILVDMASDPTPANRPYLCGYKAEDIVNWRTTYATGDEILEMIVLREYEEIPSDKDEFKLDCITQYRVCELVNGIYQQQVWREATDKSGTWVRYGPVITPTRRSEPLGFIPFVFVGSQHSTPTINEPPLIDLADLNLGHWRNSCDHEYGLHLIALPTPWVAGAKSSGQPDEPMKIGPSVVWELSEQGSAGMVEFTGAGLKSILDSMEEKKKQMAVIGSRMLEDVPQVSETATAVQIRRGGEHATLRTVANAVEQALTLVLQIVSWWTSSATEVTTIDAWVELNKDYFNVKVSAPEVQAALAALQEGKISFDTWYTFLTTGVWGREGVDAEQEKEEILKETPDAEEDEEDEDGDEDEDEVPPDDVVKKMRTRTVKDGAGNVKYVIEEEMR